MADVELDDRLALKGSIIKIAYDEEVNLIGTIFVETVADGDYNLTTDLPHARTITLVRTKTASGTCTVTAKIGSTALGGTANSASSTAQEQAHASNNAAVKGNTVKVTVSANAAALGLEVSFYGVAP